MLRTPARIADYRFINRSFEVDNFDGYIYGRKASRLDNLLKPAFQTPDRSTTLALGLDRSYNIVRRALEKTRSALADITSIERISVAICKRRGYSAR